MKSCLTRLRGFFSRLYSEWLSYDCKKCDCQNKKEQCEDAKMQQPEDKREFLDAGDSC